MYSDSHLHLADLHERDPSFPGRLPSPDWRGAAVAHDAEEFARSERLRELLPRTVAGFGIHPQALSPDAPSRGAEAAEFLCSLAARGRIAFIGEAGFDFFGDRPERVRNEENLRRQREAFEFQLSLAAKRGLPLLIHSRKGTDLLLGYGKELRRLPSVIFHGWPGRLQDARAFLDKGVPAYFSFGTTILRAARHALESCAGLPEDRILSETDAPWQPPRGESWTGVEHIRAVTEAIAVARRVDCGEMAVRLRANFNAAFRLEE